jgi:adenylate cyclase
MPDSPDPEWLDGEMRAVLTGEHQALVRFRTGLKRVPSPPRCKLCAAPFAGPGGAILRHFGFAPFAGNPALCENCITGFTKSGITGAEIPVSLLFADVRGSTAIAETMRPAEFRGYLDRFYRFGSDAILGRDGIVDKLVGDEVIGLFFGGVTGAAHAAAAIAAARELLVRVRARDAGPTGPIPVGAAVHTGDAYVGVTGPEGAVTDFTALGDVVNTTARLAAKATAGELLVSIDAAHAAGLALEGLDRRTLDVRGRAESIGVVSLRP